MSEPASTAGHHPDLIPPLLWLGSLPFLLVLGLAALLLLRDSKSALGIHAVAAISSGALLWVLVDAIASTWISRYARSHEITTDGGLFLTGLIVLALAALLLLFRSLFLWPRSWELGATITLAAALLPLALFLISMSIDAFSWLTFAVVSSLGLLWAGVAWSRQQWRAGVTSDAAGSAAAPASQSGGWFKGLGFGRDPEFGAGSGWKSSGQASPSGPLSPEEQAERDFARPGQRVRGIDKLRQKAGIKKKLSGPKQAPDARP